MPELNSFFFWPQPVSQCVFKDFIDLKEATTTTKVVVGVVKEKKKKSNRRKMWNAQGEGGTEKKRDSRAREHQMNERKKSNIKIK